VTVCGNECKFDAASSTSTKAVCNVPALSTTYSEYCLGITEKTFLAGTPFADTQAQAQLAFNAENQLDYSSANSGCFVGTDLGEGNVGVLS